MAEVVVAVTTVAAMAEGVSEVGRAVRNDDERADARRGLN